jgi:DNA polymerase III epsilon subunit-like protein
MNLVKPLDNVFSFMNFATIGYMLRSRTRMSMDSVAPMPMESMMESSMMESIVVPETGILPIEEEAVPTLVHPLYAYPEMKTMPPKKTLKRVLVFDVEATGLCPKHTYGQPFPADHMYPHILQLCYIVYDMEQGKIVDQMNEYVRIPKHIPITEEIQRITGITPRTIRARGQPIAPLLLRFYDAMLKCDAVVAHNIQYDKTVIRQEMYRNKKDLVQLTGSIVKGEEMARTLTEKFCVDRGIQTVCTMRSTIQTCNLWYVPKGMNADGSEPASRRKMPKLCELYEYLFEEPAPSGMHDALVDVQACLKCFLELKRRETAEHARAIMENLV